ncbi:hypothetical protein GCM10027422_35880 [Hymenobacter arcticus]
MRPTDDTKTFAGQALSFAQLQAWHQQLAQLVFAAPRAIEKEWRHVLMGGQVVTSTRYQWRGEPQISATDVLAGLLAFVADCCAAYQPHDVFVLDTALADGRYFIVECILLQWHGLLLPVGRYRARRSGRYSLAGAKPDLTAGRKRGCLNSLISPDASPTSEIRRPIYYDSTPQWTTQK